MTDAWNKCEKCGRFISFDDLISGKATSTMVEPDSEFSGERFEFLCREHAEPRRIARRMRPPTKPIPIVGS